MTELAAAQAKIAELEHKIAKLTEMRCNGRSKCKVYRAQYYKHKYPPGSRNEYMREYYHEYCK